MYSFASSFTIIHWNLVSNHVIGFNIFKMLNRTLECACAW